MSATVTELRWGRSVLGCARCHDAHALAGWELRYDGLLAGRLCDDCANSGSIFAFAASAPGVPLGSAD